MIVGSRTNSLIVISNAIVVVFMMVACMSLTIINHNKRRVSKMSLDPQSKSFVETRLLFFGPWAFLGNSKSLVDDIVRLNGAPGVLARYLALAPPF